MAAFGGTGPAGSATPEAAELITGGTRSAATPNAGLGMDWNPDYFFYRQAWWKYVAPATGYILLDTYCTGGPDDNLHLNDGYYQASRAYNEDTQPYLVDETFAELPSAADTFSFRHMLPIKTGGWGYAYEVEAGKTYYILVGCWEDSDADYVLNVSRVMSDVTSVVMPDGVDNHDAAPAIKVPGVAYARPAASASTFTVEAGEPTFTYYGGPAATNFTAWWRLEIERDCLLTWFRNGTYEDTWLYRDEPLSATMTPVAGNGQYYNAVPVNAGTYYLRMSRNAVSGSNYFPYITAWPYTTITVPVTNVFAPGGSGSGGSIGQIVGGAGALATDDEGSYLQAFSNGKYFRADFAPTAIDDNAYVLGVSMCADVSVVGWNPPGYGTMSTYWIGPTGNGRGGYLGPVTGTHARHWTYVWAPDNLSLDQIRAGITGSDLSFRVASGPLSKLEEYKLSYLALEVYVLAEDPEVVVPFAMNGGLVGESRAFKGVRR